MTIDCFLFSSLSSDLLLSAFSDEIIILSAMGTAATINLLINQDSDAAIKLLPTATASHHGDKERYHGDKERYHGDKERYHGDKEKKLHVDVHLAQKHHDA